MTRHLVRTKTISYREPCPNNSGMTHILRRRKPGRRVRSARSLISTIVQSCSSVGTVGGGVGGGGGNTPYHITTWSLLTANMDEISYLGHMTKIWSVWSRDSQQLIGQVMWPYAHQGAECTYRCGRAGFASGPPRAPPRWDWCRRRWSAQCQQEHSQLSVSDRGHFQMDESRWSAMSLGREGRTKFLFIDKSECYVVSPKQSSINFHSKHISVGSLPNMVIYLHNKGWYVIKTIRVISQGVTDYQ